MDDLKKEWLKEKKDKNNDHDDHDDHDDPSGPPVEHCPIDQESMDRLIRKLRESEKESQKIAGEIAALAAITKVLELFLVADEAALAL